MTLHFNNIINLIINFKFYHLLEDGKWGNMKKSLWYLTAIIHETSAKQPEIRGEEAIPKEEVSCQLRVTNILLKYETVAKICMTNILYKIWIWFFIFIFGSLKLPLSYIS